MTYLLRVIPVADALYFATGVCQHGRELEPGMGEGCERESAGAAGRRPSGRRTAPPKPPCRAPEEHLQLWHAPEVYWPAADRFVRIVKTVRTQERDRVQVSPEASGKKKKKTKEAVHKEATNYYATNLELGSVPPSLSPNWATAAGRSTPKCSRPSPLRLISSTPPSIKPVRWSC